MDRAAALRQAEKLLRQGRVDAAIAAYARVIAAQPRDWNIRNLLGDLYVRAGQPAKAADQFVRVAEGLAEQGFLSKASAVYRKALRHRPGDERTLLRSAAIAASRGLLASARAYLLAVGQARLERGDLAGAEEVSTRLAALELAEPRPPEVPPPTPPAVPGATAAAEVAGPAASHVPPPTVDEAPDVEVIPPAGVTVERPGDRELDLTGLLEELPRSAPVAPTATADLESVFAELRNAARVQSEAESLDAVYARGLALYEAGAIDEGLQALRAAARAPHLRFDAASLVGRIWRSRGELVEAVEWFERAAEAPAPSVDAAQRLMYDLAVALEEAGEHARALAVLLELQADAGHYRDIGMRIDRLLTTS